MRPLFCVKSISWFILLLFLIGACSSGQKQTQKPQTEAEKVYLEAKELADSNRFLIAIERLNYLKSTYPYSYYTKAADLLIADIFYMQESYEEATASYLLYREMHPRDEKLSYVLFKIAESYFKQIPSTHDRDLTPAIKAIDYYNQLLERFPGSEYIQGAREKIAKAQKKLRLKEQYIADFYFKTKVFQAAKIRYLRILQMYREDPKARDEVFHAVVRFVESSLMLEEYENCLEYGKELRVGLPKQYTRRLERIMQKCRQGA